LRNSLTIEPSRVSLEGVMDLTALLTSFALIFPVELPDKTFVAALVLATRFRALPVWIGVSAAFLIQCVVAVSAGQLLSLLPMVIVHGVAAALFAVGAVVLLKGARKADVHEAEQEHAFEAKMTDGPTGGVRAFGTSFAVLFAAEWGDLSQLLTAGLAARFQAPVPVFLGAVAGALVVTGIAVLAGRTFLKRVRPGLVATLGGLVCAALALVTAAPLLTGLLLR
jgi:putative Ca2+/H+ antiporter (TMEM165/GDT1 family)